MLPEVQLAIDRVSFELTLVRNEDPDWTPNQQLQEASRRCCPALTAAADAIDARRGQRWARPGGQS